MQAIGTTIQILDVKGVHQDRSGVQRQRPPEVCMGSGDEAGCLHIIFQRYNVKKVKLSVIFIQCW